MDGIGRVALRPGPVKNAKRIGLVIITHTPAALGTALFDRLLVPGRQLASAALLFGGQASAQEVSPPCPVLNLRHSAPELLGNVMGVHVDGIGLLERDNVGVACRQDCRLNHHIADPVALDLIG